MTVRSFAALIAVVLAGGTAYADAPPLDTAAIEAVAREEMGKLGVPGLAVAIVRGERVMFAKGFGVASVETGTPVTPDSLFRLGSTTKMFTAATAVGLSEEGKLKLHAPIGDIIKDLPEFLRPLTLHQLLSHTSGIRDVAPMFGKHDDAELGRGIRSWDRSWLVREPGKTYAYSNPGYWLAGLAIEEASGKPFADAVADRMFRPLGMTRTTFRPTLAMTYPLALGHGPDGKVIRPMADNAGSWPAGSIFSSINDLTRWAMAFLHDGNLDGRQAVPATVLKVIATPHVAVPTRKGHYGYGLVIADWKGEPIIEHTGSRSGYGSLIRFLPRRQAAVIVLANRTAASLPQTVGKATELLVGSTANP
ncbi:MAG: serine hydrolase domain-containing protein [Gemmataceae bacterium]